MADAAKVADELGRNFIAKPKVYLAALYAAAGLMTFAYMAEQAAANTNVGIWPGFGSNAGTASTILQNVAAWPYVWWWWHKSGGGTNNPSNG